ncbi:MAG: hypothetical protein DCC67_07440 [Planctomycetota bacterium]|nr:MAG: hypothetical protein DCC67_07440 [Planctomycetota bacterium]
MRMQLPSASRRASRPAIVAVAIAAAASFANVAQAQTVRNYNVNFTSAAPVIDGVVGPGEWNAAASAAGSWGELRQPEWDADIENNRFRMLWDANNLYVLYETDFNSWIEPVDKINNPNPDIVFDHDNMSLYFDPNADGDANFASSPDDYVDGYQLAFNQYRDPAGGALISTDANRQGVGFFTEAHAGYLWGDHARWNRGGVSTSGPALQDIVVAQKNGAAGGVAEMIIPWNNFNADALYPGDTDVADFNSDGLVEGADLLAWQKGYGSAAVDKSTGDANGDLYVDVADLEVWETNYATDTRQPTGLDRVAGPVTGEQWFFQMSRINGLGDIGNFLPLWNWHEGQYFAQRPHGTITFLGGPASAVPEPAAVAMIAAAAALALAARRHIAG